MTQHADLVIVIDGGRIIQQGTYEALQNVEVPSQTLVLQYGQPRTNATECTKEPDRLESGGPIGPRYEHSETIDERERTTAPSGDNVSEIFLDEEFFTGGISGTT